MPCSNFWRGIGALKIGRLVMLKKMLWSLYLRHVLRGVQSPTTADKCQCVLTNKLFFFRFGYDTVTVIFFVLAIGFKVRGRSQMTSRIVLYFCLLSPPSPYPSFVVLKPLYIVLSTQNYWTLPQSAWRHLWAFKVFFQLKWLHRSLPFMTL